MALAGSFVGNAASARVEPQASRQGCGRFVVAMAFFILAPEVPALVGRTPSALLGLAVSVVGSVGAPRLRATLSATLPESARATRERFLGSGR